ncbi:MAG: chalcone isomerase family protein [Limnohabitans sp.]
MTTRRAWMLGGLLAVVSLSQWPLAIANPRQDASPQQQQRMQGFLNAPRLVGQHRFTYWGFEVYDASLWAGSEFSPEDWAQQALILELRYLRDFKGSDIAQRSIDEMHGQRALNPVQLRNWLETLQKLMPNIRSGERLTGVYRPDKGMQLLHQDRLVGEVRDAELARRFLGIWLAPETSQRQLRQQLLAGARP